MTNNTPVLIDPELLKLCDHCLGRTYAKLGHGLSNFDRGRALRIYYALTKNLDLNTLVPKNCTLCSNLFDNIDKYVTIILKNLENLEFNTFLVGSRVDADILAQEQLLQSKYGALGERINTEINREVGKKLSIMLDKEVDFHAPDVVVVIDTMYDSVELTISPVFIEGKYRKFERGLFQTRMQFNRHLEAIDYYIGTIAKQMFEAQDYIFHGMGREDVDVRMLGTGRPFVLELKAPKKRNVDLIKLQKDINAFAVNKLEVFDLKFSTRARVRAIKNSRSKKTYRIVIQLEKEISMDKLKEALKLLEAKVIYQRTPLRSLRYRSDLVRERRVYNVTLKSLNNTVAVLTLQADAGLYIKELFHGDAGRTDPSLAKLINQKIKILDLDVISIETLEDHNK